MASDEIRKLADQIVERMRREEIFTTDGLQGQQENEEWDSAAKRIVGRVVRDVFGSVYGEEAAKRLVYVEEEDLSLPAWLKTQPYPHPKPYRTFGGLGSYPDLAVKKPSIAIELDHSKHSKEGVAGGYFKSALGKAAFNCISGDWDYCLLLFHNQSGTPMKKWMNRPIETRALQKYEREFNTSVAYLPE